MNLFSRLFLISILFCAALMPATGAAQSFEPEISEEISAEETLEELEHNREKYKENAAPRNPDAETNFYADEADSLRISERQGAARHESHLRLFKYVSERRQRRNLSFDPSNRNWWYLLRHGKLNLSDTTVEYPRFLRFCVNAYNWFNLNFDSYDPEYVVGTGYNAKIRLCNDNWQDSYSMHLDRRMPIRLMSDFYPNVGAYFQYSVLSVGTSIDLAKVIGDKGLHHRKTEFGFTCARFSVNVYHYSNKGGSFIRTFGDYLDGQIFKERLTGVNIGKGGIDVCYFFNNKRYSQAAAYDFSKIQKRSQGTFIMGFSWSNLNVLLDFTTLPSYLLPYMTINPDKYRFHHKNYSLMLGYGFNWVISKHLLFNVTATPSIGVAYCYADSQEGEGRMISMNVKGRGSLTYNLKRFFICAIAKIDGNWYKSYNYSLFSAVEMASLNIGYRF